jgi:hypothetical protein
MPAEPDGFPHCGKMFSIVWKNPEKFFHCVENCSATRLSTVNR